MAAVNAVQGMPTQALESWTVEVLSDPSQELETDSDFEVRRLIPTSAAPANRRKETAGRRA